MGKVINKKSFRQRFGTALSYFFLPIAVFLFTLLTGTGTVAPAVALLLAVGILAVRFAPRSPAWLSTLLWVTLVLFLTAATGWFFSPFFFALYLAAIALGFVYTPMTATAFVLSLMLLFSFDIGEVNPSYDFLTLLSLFTAIPITVILRRKFLLLQQSNKGILILESESHEAGITSLDQVLQNRVNQIGTRLRQPLTYLKQGLALLAGNELNEKEYPDILSRMRKAVEELFTLDREFERGATKNKFLKGKEEPPDAANVKPKGNFAGEIKKPKGAQ